MVRRDGFGRACVALGLIGLVGAVGVSGAGARSTGGHTAKKSAFYSTCRAQLHHKGCKGEFDFFTSGDAKSMHTGADTKCTVTSAFTGAPIKIRSNGKFSGTEHFGTQPSGTAGNTTAYSITAIGRFGTSGGSGGGSGSGREDDGEGGSGGRVVSVARGKLRVTNSSGCDTGFKKFVAIFIGPIKAG